jgi:hypothetical protein
MYRDEIKNKTTAPGASGAPSGLGGSSTSGGSSVPGASGTPGLPSIPGAPSLAATNAHSADAGLSRELFAPDNNDIIPSAGHQGGHSTAHSAGHPGGHPTGRAGEHPTGRAIELKGMDIGGQSAAQYPVYQTGGFARSSTIERIVVFYKDKTFSEYQPE